MKKKFPDSNDVKKLIGPLNDNAVAEILSFSPSWYELEVAVAYLAGESDVMQKEEMPLSGIAAEILEIVRQEELLGDESQD